ncbi:ArgE/DapE family deacylase [Enterococcus raffinosus]|uniref:Probable succinyl-diaminopimelate desuccinylase n=1 Tax=Enterococcus raffinosus TaxID=71452 RepID=A0AAW8SQ98_9ENTE|nr:ArgE/DapE family deacylase [Enterococcus raffinosus]MBS6430865.1 ArgE/DapE family deacylase [Enterococcus raffinosus]MDK7990347.1 ArgE/DapE family deacylase [Enterococcus raffinosus]MDT2536947.1 ArgE/DapE family deacylase [Enterococcus raffinosus]OJG85602.1 ArgE/DapE family peptidase [Enterococcus raffinosus]UXJ97935.1 ArgE/DapE family deacylase [Enterococcus raffinosus]
MEKEKRIAILQDVIKIRSVNNNEAEVADYYAKLLQTHGIDSTKINYQEGRDNLVATIKKGNSKKVLGLSGHMDVVDAGDESQWKFPPYEAVIDDNKLYGRGSTDMKSGLTAMVIAMIELAEEEVSFDGTVKLLATVGEEIGELGAQQLTEAGYADDLTGLLIGEPTKYNLMYAHMGSINYSVISRGKEAHSSMPEQGFNAINHLNEFITRVNKEMATVAENYVNEDLGRTIHNVTVIKGGNQVNSIPSYAELQGNIRSIPNFSNDEVKSLLTTIINELNEGSDYKLELSIDFNKIPVKADKNSALIQAVQDQFEKPLPLVTAAGTTDAAEFTKSENTFDFVVFGPGEPTLPHQINEYVEIDNYLDMIDKYKSIIKTYLR